MLMMLLLMLMMMEEREGADASCKDRRSMYARTQGVHSVHTTDTRGASITHNQEYIRDKSVQLRIRTVNHILQK